MTSHSLARAWITRVLGLDPKNNKDQETLVLSEMLHSAIFHEDPSYLEENNPHMGWQSRAAISEFLRRKLGSTRIEALASAHKEFPPHH